MLELRPDSVAVLFTLLALLALNRKAVRSSGIFLGLAVFCSEKAVVYAPALPLALLLLSKRESFVRLVVSGALTSSALFGALLLACGWEPVRLFFVDWTVAHEHSYIARGAFAQLAPFGVELLVFAALTGVGAFLTFNRFNRENDGAVSDIALLLLLFLGFLSYAMQRGPYPYSLLPALAPAVVFSSRVFALVRRVRIDLTAVAVLALVSIFPLAPSETNAEQLALLRDIDALVPKGECVYDNSGAAVTRPHVAFYFFTDAIMRKIFAPSFERELLPKIRRMNCPAIIKDYRFDELPPAFREALTADYPHCRGKLCFKSRQGPGL